MVEMPEAHLHEGPGIHFLDVKLVVTTFVILCDFKIIIFFIYHFTCFFGSLDIVGSKKVRGETNNSKLEKLWEKNGRNPLPINFDTHDCRTFRPVGTHASIFKFLVGSCVRANIPQIYDSWERVPESTKEIIWPTIEVINVYHI